MSLIWFALGLFVGAVFGAKHQAMTLYFYEHVKPFLKAWKANLIKKFSGWFAKK